MMPHHSETRKEITVKKKIQELLTKRSLSETLGFMSLFKISEIKSDFN